MHKIISLNGRWGFIIDPSNRGLRWGKYHEPIPRKVAKGDRAAAGDLHRGFDDLLLDEVAVPGSWQRYRPEYRWFDGTAFFFKRLADPRRARGARVWLNFHAVSFRARAWLNGLEIGAMDHPFLPWKMEITGALKQENLLVVRVEGSPRPDDTVPIAGWRQYSGLIRPVDLVVTGPTAWASVLVDPELDLATSRGRVRVRLVRDGSPGTARQLHWQLNGRTGVIALKAGKVGWSGCLPWQPVKPWDIGQPNLYPLRLELRGNDGTLLDMWEQAVGFRHLGWNDRRLLLNGRPVFLRGVSRHDQSPVGGMTLTDAEIRRDFDLIEELGCNMVRLAHYPQDERALDECDRRGLLAWVEIPIYWQVDWNRPIVRRRMLAQMEGLVRRDYHHPGVALWSVANEIHSDNPRALAALKASHALVRRLDPHRPTTFASWPLNPQKNAGLQVVDICAINIYRGWYNPDIVRLAEDLRGVARATGKPVLHSEFGAGAVAGRHGSDQEEWTEEYQARVIRENLTIDRRGAAGAILWLLHDFLDPSRVHSRITDGFINNKGLVTVDRRRKKLAFETVRRIFTTWANEDAVSRVTE